MSKQRKTREANTRNEGIFENKIEEQFIIISLNPIFQKIRKGNQYIGEKRIMQNLSRKNKETLNNHSGSLYFDL